MNRSSTSDLVENTLYEVGVGKNPSFSHLRVFGHEAFVHFQKEKRSKLDRNSKKCIFIGYKDGVKGYKLWRLMIRKIIYRRDVIFEEVKHNSKTKNVKSEK